MSDLSLYIYEYKCLIYTVIVVIIHIYFSSTARYILLLLLFPYILILYKLYSLGINYFSYIISLLFVLPPKIFFLLFLLSFCNSLCPLVIGVSCYVACQNHLFLSLYFLLWFVFISMCWSCSVIFFLVNPNMYHLNMLLWVIASFCSIFCIWVHVSQSYIITGSVHILKSFLLKHIDILLSFRKFLYRLHTHHSDCIQYIIIYIIFNFFIALNYYENWQLTYKYNA